MPATNPHGLGMQSGSITVTDAGLTIGFVPKPWSSRANNHSFFYVRDFNTKIAMFSPVILGTKP